MSKRRHEDSNYSHNLNHWNPFRKPEAPALAGPATCQICDCDLSYADEWACKPCRFGWTALPRGGRWRRRGGDDGDGVIERVGGREDGVRGLEGED